MAQSRITLNEESQEAYRSARALARNELEKAIQQKAQLERHIAKLKAAVTSLDMMLRDDEDSNSKTS